MKASNAKIKSLAADSITIYANTEKISSNEVRLYVFVQHKNQWLNQSSPIVQTINKDLYTFAVNESRKPVEKRIVALTKDIDKYSKHTKEAQKENERLKKEIERCKHVIKNNEEKISENEKRISSNYAETEELKKQLNELQQQLKNIK
jgi:chromosome segregation ATPase